MNLLLFYCLVAYFVYCPVYGNLDSLAKHREKRIVAIDKEFICPDGWNLAFRVCYKSFAPPKPGLTADMISKECEKYGAKTAPMRNSAEEIGVRKSLKLFRNSTKINDLIIVGIRQNIREILGLGTSLFYRLNPFWMGIADIDPPELYITSRYNKFIPQKTPATPLTYRFGMTNEVAHAQAPTCLTYDSETMLMDEIFCDCIKYDCKNPHEVSAITCSQYATFNGQSAEHFYKDPSVFARLPSTVTLEYTKKYKCDDGWTLVVTNEANFTNPGIEGICMKAFKPNGTYVTYHSSEQVCDEFEARPSAPNSISEEKAAISLLNGLYNNTYTANVYVGIRLLESFVGIDDEKYRGKYDNLANEYINDWDAKPWIAKSRRYDILTNIQNRTHAKGYYYPHDLIPNTTTTFVYPEQAKFMGYPNDPAVNSPHFQHYCMIWDLKFGYRAWFCEAGAWASKYPVKAVLCSKLATWKFIPATCTERTTTNGTVLTAK